MAISQEGMEACQKRNNTFMRCINGFANAGRRPWRVVQQGREAVRSYMEARAKNKKSPEQVLWWKNLFAYVAGYSEVYERVEAHKREGRTCKWAGAFGPAWDSFWAISTFRTIIVARWRRNWLHAGGGVPVPPGEDVELGGQCGDQGTDGRLTILALQRYLWRLHLWVLRFST